MGLQLRGRTAANGPAKGFSKNWTITQREGKSMRTFTCAAVTLAAVALLAPFGRAAFAQAGSTGGTLGNTDKSISGDRREEPAAPKSQAHRSASAPAKAKTKSSGCGNVVGAYQWAVGIGVLKSGGVATSSVPGVQGTWTCTNGQVTVIWNNGYTDHLTPTPNGFSAVNSGGIHFDVVRM
jgi:hypothetical protein